MADAAAQKSTNVRVSDDGGAAARRRAARRRRAALGLAVVRVRVALLQHVSPERAARLALDLWCTPPVGAGRRRDDRTEPGVVTAVTTDAGARVVVESWEPSPAEGRAAPVGVVHLVHGWGGWRGQLGALVEPLRAAGYRVVAADAPSHGDSGPGALGPRRSTLPEMADAIAAVARVHGDPTAVVAHSLGTATTTLAVRDGLPVGRLVLVAAIADPIGRLDQFADLLRLAPRTRLQLQAMLGRLAGRPIAEMDVHDTLRVSPVPPALVVHDRADKEVPHEIGAALAAAWPEGELLTTDGLGHQRILRDPTVVRAVVDYLAPVGAVDGPAAP